MTSDSIDWTQDVTPSPEEEYRALLRALRRRRGFGLLFVQCSPAKGSKLIHDIRRDLPQKTTGVLKFETAIEDGNFFQQVKDYLQTHDSPDILFVQGLEHSLLSYEQQKREEGWSSKDIYTYSWKAVPRLLGNLNLRRDMFRDQFSICFVFLLPLFALKYIQRRAPDFYDWRSGVFEFATDEELVKQESTRILQEANYEKYANWTQEGRDRKIITIQTLIDEVSQTSERKEKLFINLGNLFFASSKYEAAIASYDKAIAINPNDSAAWHNRGLSLDGLKHYEEAIVSYNQAITAKPDKHEAWNSRGSSLLKLGRYEEAIISYNNSLEFQNDKAETWFNRGTALFRLGRYEEAIASYSKAFELNPRYNDALYNCGIILSNSKHYEESLHYFDEALILEPEDHRIWNNRGIALNALEKYEEAITSYEKALEFKPDKYDTWYNLGLVFHRLERYEEAIASYNKVIELKPDYYQAWYTRGRSLAELGLHDEAIASFDKAIEIQPSNHLSWLNRCISLIKLKCLDEASSSLTHFMQLHQENWQYWQNQLARYEDIANKLRDAVFNFDDLELWSSLVLSMESLKESTEMIEELAEKAPDIKERYLNFQKNILDLPYSYYSAFALFYMHHKRYQDAIDSFDKASVHKPNAHDVWYNKACCYALKGQAEPAIDSLQKAIDRDPKYRDMAKTDTDFDAIRESEAFQKMLENTS